MYCRNHVDSVRDALDGTMNEDPLFVFCPAESPSHPINILDTSTYRVISDVDLSLPGALEGLFTVKGHSRVRPREPHTV